MVGGYLFLTTIGVCVHIFECGFRSYNVLLKQHCLSVETPASVQPLTNNVLSFSGELTEPQMQMQMQRHLGRAEVYVLFLFFHLCLFGNFMAPLQ